MTTTLRRNPTLLVLASVLIIAALAIAWWLGSPLFLNQAVNDAPIVSDISNTANDSARVLPISMRTGMFRNGDDFHQGSGRAVIYQLPDGTQQLQLEDFKVTNGPDLFVVLTSAADPTTSSEVYADGYVEIARLKGNLGNQVYELPADLDLSKANSVVIYCRAFSVVFSVAPLANVAG